MNRRLVELLLVSTLRILLLSALIAILIPSPSDVAAKELVVITVFIPSQDTTTSNGKCVLDTKVRTILRFEQMNAGSQQIIVTMPLRDGERVGSDNDIAPGETGCVITRKLALDPASDYSVTSSGREIAVLEADMMAHGDSPTMILALNVVSGQPSIQWLLPEHASAQSTIAPLATTSPTQESVTPTREISRTPRDGSQRGTRDASQPAPTSTSASTQPKPTPTPIPTLAPISAGDQGDGTYLLRGSLQLDTDRTIHTVLGCFGYGGYADIGSGTQVVVRDGDNNVLGIGELVAINQYEGKVGCTFEFEIEVEESSFYQIEMSHRGQMIYTFDDLEDTGWTVFLSLGD